MTIDVYQKYKLPPEWEWKKLGEICAVTDRDHRTPSYTEDGVPLISPRDFTETGIDVSNLKQVVRSELDAFVKKCKPEKGDILYSRIGTIGEARLLNFDFEFVALHSIALVKPIVEGLESKYILYLLQTPDVREQAKHNIKSVGTPDLGLKRIKDFAVPVAPPEQQKRIVAEIEKQFSRLDGAVANLKRVKANLRRYKAAILKAAVEGKLTEGWRKAHPDVEPVSELLKRILAERRTRSNGRGKYKEPNKPDTIDLRPLPKRWVWARVEQLAATTENSLSSGPFGSNLGTKDYVVSGVPVLRGRNIQNGRIISDEFVYVSEKKAQDLKRSMAFPGDVVVIAVGSSGRPGIIPKDLARVILSQNCNKITCETNIVMPEYLNLFLTTDLAQKQIAGKTTDTVRKFFSLTNFRQILVSLPPPAEQIAIIADADRGISAFEAVERQVDAGLRRVDRLRQTILRQAFSGNLLNGNNGPRKEAGLDATIERENEINIE